MVRPQHIVTLARLPLAFLLIFIVAQQNTLLALVTLGIIALSDWLDGTIARRRNDASHPGKVLDIAVDFTLICLLIPSLAFIRSGEWQWLLLTPVLAVMGIGYVSWLMGRKDASGTVLGKPYMTVAIFASYISLIADFFWTIVLALTAALWLLNIALLLSGHYKQDDEHNKVRGMKKKAAR